MIITVYVQTYVLCTKRVINIFENGKIEIIYYNYNAIEHTYIQIYIHIATITMTKQHFVCLVLPSHASIHMQPPPKLTSPTACN